MRIIKAIIAGVTLLQLFTIGFGLTMILVISGRVCYALRMMGMKTTIKHAVITEAIGISWIPIKSFVFPSVKLQVMNIIISLVCFAICAGIEAYDNFTYTYDEVYLDEEEKRNE